MTEFPHPRGCPLHPPREYAGMRAERPISRVTLASGRQSWLLTRHEHIRKLLASPDVSSNLAHPGYPLPFNVPAEILEKQRPAMLAQDPPVHTAQRRLVVPEFTVKRLARLRPRIQEIVGDHLTAMLTGDGADLVAALAIPVPSLVICELLGVPYDDRAFFGERTTKLISISAEQQERFKAHQELQEYFGRLVAAKRENPGDDLISRVIEKNADLDQGELVKLASVLLVGGHETTANMIALGTLALLEHPDQLAKLVADPALASAAVDELLRFFSIADQVTARVAMADIEIGGTVIRAGEGVIGLNAAANHDEAVYAHPEEFDVDRGGKHHLAFGYGIHQCIGQNLAKLELEIVFTTLFERIPGLKLATPLDELPFKDNAGVYGLHALPVTW